MIVKYITDTQTYLDNFAKCKATNDSVLLIGTTTNLTVYDTGRKDINYEECAKENAVIIPMTSNGGAAVTLPGDIGFYFSNHSYIAGWCKYIFAELQRWLSSRGVLTTFRNNDLAIYGKKFAGYTEHPSKNYSFGIIFIAMNNAQDYVNKFFTKAKTKETIGLRDFGLIADEIIQVVIKATKNYLMFVKESDK